MNKLLSSVAVMSLALAVMLALPTDQASAQAASAANKIRTAGSTLAVTGPTAPVTVLSTTVKTSANADLLLSAAAECAIAFSDLDVLTSSSFSFQGSTSSTTGLDFDALFALVEVWVEIDGVPVPVNAAATPPDNGRVAFCRLDRSSTGFLNVFLSVGATGFTAAFGSTTTQLVESQFEAGRTANAFNWHAKNVGPGTHTVDVRAQVLQASVGAFASGGSFVSNPPGVQGVIGNRTLIVEPVAPGK